jgi:CRISPR-associated protein Csx14
MRVGLEKGIQKAMANKPWNFWSGQQTSEGIWKGLRTELITQMVGLSPTQLESLFEQRLFQKGRFGFDPGPAWNALDTGFSPNEQGLEVESSPAVELLAAVGLQRFRPIMNEDRDGFDYFTWHNALPPSVAAAAMAGGLPQQSLRYRAVIVGRGQYGALGFSFLILPGDARE